MSEQGRYKEGEANRQRVLNYLHEHPGANVPEIIKACGFKKNHGSSLMKRMADSGEVRREKLLMQGPFGPYQTFECWALVKTPISRSEVVANTTRNLLGNDPDSPVHKDHNVWVGGFYRNNPNNRAAISAQGGQGSYAPRMATYLEVNA